MCASVRDLIFLDTAKFWIGRLRLRRQLVVVDS